MRVSRSKRREQKYVPISPCVDIAKIQMIMEMILIRLIPTCLQMPPCPQPRIDLFHQAQSWDKGGDRVYKLREAIHGLEEEVSLLRKRLPRIEDRV